MASRSIRFPSEPPSFAEPDPSMAASPPNLRDTPPGQQNVSLGDAINTATRGVHAKLNKLLLQRLPLAIPPRAETPTAYVSGLLHVTPMYAAYEQTWQKLLDRQASFDQTSSSSSLQTDNMPVTPPMPDHVHAILTGLFLPSLQRTARMKADIRALTGWSVQETEEQLQAITKAGHLSVFVRHIKQVAESRPHCLLAYAWVCYMALFSGGRVIRASLESAGERFWKTTPSPIHPAMAACQPPDLTVDPMSENIISDESHRTRQRATTNPEPAHAHHQRFPLAFFHFDTPRDGEDLKQEFKKRLADAEGLLSEQERHDIVAEAECIFHNLVLLVAQLDGVCGTALDEPTGSEGLARLLSPRRFRDSIAVSKERARKQDMQHELDSGGLYANPLPRAPTHLDPDSASTSTSEVSSASLSSSLDSPTGHLPDSVITDALLGMGTGGKRHASCPAMVWWDQTTGNPHLGEEGDETDLRNPLSDAQAKPFPSMDGTTGDVSIVAAFNMSSVKHRFGYGVMSTHVFVAAVLGTLSWALYERLG